LLIRWHCEQTGKSYVCTADIPGQLVSGLLLVDEDNDGRGEFFRVEDFDEALPVINERRPESSQIDPLPLVLAHDELHALLDRVDCLTSHTDGHDRWSPHVLSSQTLDGRGHRS
jgi:hypothetical protein